ncbi:MAG TPA: glycoside hydrolase family 15 protein [Segeticoccus sp.]|uniref:glycoside hydrolase family 15 protein n=1 Tax=Segeticoccus sp. TaxID=2706531 RepID=UPI002D7E3A30|nr:glycoside hydrolase family 15 protein [Segeticoccus sp.]HET8599117.1 glycoside hydrolase family 15 protein [Segeticoccus sp.]
MGEQAAHPDRVDGFLPLADYGALGDGRAAALVGRDGSIDWFAAPRMDVAPLCSALLDPGGGGAITLAPTVDYESSQRYVSDSMAVETTFRCRHGEVRVTDVLNLGGFGPLPWTELARRIEPVSGAVPMRWAVRPGHRLGPGRPWTRSGSGTPTLQAGDVHLLIVTDGVGTPAWGSGQVAGEFTAEGEQPRLLCVVVNGQEPLPLPTSKAVQGRVDHTIETWQSWCGDIDYDGSHRDEVHRSALILRALTFSSSGAIAAALTTSLPERIGSKRNFDYRFGWIRDASFSLDAMATLRLTEEVQGSVSWLLAAVRRTAPEIRSLYTLDGIPASADMESVPWVRGYRDSLPVHVGNSAADQRQLGAYGDLMDGVWRHICNGGQLDHDSAEALARVADRVCDIWRTKDAGIWELGDLAHYTISKIGCWVALDRACRLAEAGQLTTHSLSRWRTEREAVHAWADEHCWSPTKRSYTFYAGTDELDAAVLLAARTGFLPGDDPRLASTIDAVRSELSAGGPLLYRYSGMASEEGAFLACTFWLIEALAMSGRVEEGTALLQQALRYAGPTGLFSEEVDPQSGELRGNLPQGLSHLALIGAAKAVQR